MYLIVACFKIYLNIKSCYIMMQKQTFYLEGAIGI